MKMITELEFSKLIDLHKETPVAVAVSGGADSLCLAILLKRWGAQNLLALTVDHKLRQESSNEALWVAETMAQYGIEHEILTWHHSGIRSKVQEQAREARYKLLWQAANKRNIKYLALGHHALDQLETFAMRLNKGSNLPGLTGMRSLSVCQNGYLLRPLLHIDPKRIKDTLRIMNQDYVDDPSNYNCKYQRTMWREAYSNGLLSLEGFLKSIEKLQKAHDVFSKTVNEFLVVNFSYHFPGYWILKNLNSQPEYLQELILQKIFKTKYPKNLAKINLARKHTVAGYVIMPWQNMHLLWREVRSAPKELVIQNPGKYFWFNREIVIDESDKLPLVLKLPSYPLHPKLPCQEIWYSIPTLWQQDELYRII